MAVELKGFHKKKKNSFEFLLVLTVIHTGFSLMLNPKKKKKACT